MLDEVELKKIFGKKLRLIRKSKKLTQEKLSELADLDPQHYCKIEAGTYFPSSKTLVKIANTFGIEISELFKNDNSENEDLEKLLFEIKQLNPEELIFLKSFVSSLKTFNKH